MKDTKEGIESLFTTDNRVSGFENVERWLFSAGMTVHRKCNVRDPKGNLHPIMVQMSYGFYNANGKPISTKQALESDSHAKLLGYSIVDANTLKRIAVVGKIISGEILFRGKCAGGLDGFDDKKLTSYDHDFSEFERSLTNLKLYQKTDGTLVFPNIYHYAGLSNPELLDVKLACEAPPYFVNNGQADTTVVTDALDNWAKNGEGRVIAEHAAGLNLCPNGIFDELGLLPANSNQAGNLGIGQDQDPTFTSTTLLSSGLIVGGVTLYTLFQLKPFFHSVLSFGSNIVDGLLDRIISTGDSDPQVTSVVERMPTSVAVRDGTTGDSDLQVTSVVERIPTTVAVRDGTTGDSDPQVTSVVERMPTSVAVRPDVSIEQGVATMGDSDFSSPELD